jgi:hypothetical protein
MLNEIFRGLLNHIKESKKDDYKHAILPTESNELVIQDVIK